MTAAPLEGEKSLLILDDDAAFRTRLARALEQRGFQVTAVGSVAFDENLLAVVPARVEGYVTRLYVRAPLERVRRGQPLADIQAPAWLEAQQEYLALLDAQSEAARTLRNAARERLRILGVPDSTVTRIDSDRKTNATTTITSPIVGASSGSATALTERPPTSTST